MHDVQLAERCEDAFLRWSCRHRSGWKLLARLNRGIPTSRPALAAAADATGGTALARLVAVIVAAAPGLPLLIALRPAPTPPAGNGEEEEEEEEEVVEEEEGASLQRLQISAR